MVAYYSNRHAGLMQMPPVLPNGKDWSGRVVGVFDDYVATGDEAAGSSIIIGFIPPNARVVEGWIKHTASGAGVTLDVGIAGDADKFFNDVNVAATGLTRMISSDGMGWLNESNNSVPVVITTAGGTLTAGAIITLHLTVQGI